MSGDLIAAGDLATKLIVRSLTTGAVVHSFDHEEAVRCCAMSGDLIVSGESRIFGAWKLIVRSLTAGEEVHSFDHKSAVLCCATSGDLIAAGDRARKLIVRRRTTGEVVHSFDHTSTVTCCAMSGDLIAAGDRAKKLIVRSLTTGEVVHSFDHDREVTCCAMSGDLIAAGDRANKLIVWSRTTHAEVLSFGHTSAVTCCAMSGGLIVAGDGACKLIVRSLNTGEVVHSFDHKEAVTCCAKWGDLIAAGDAATKLIVRDLRTAGNALPGEGSLRSARDRVGRRPHLLHRPDATLQTTLLHRLARAAETEVSALELEAVLESALKHNTANKVPFVLVAVPDGDEHTPLDLAVEAGNHAKAKVLTEAYARSAKDGAWRAPSRSMSRTLKAMCKRKFPDLMIALLEAAFFDAAQDYAAGRLPRASIDRPAFRPHGSFYGVDWVEEFPALRGAAGAEPEGVEVTAHVVGMCGLLALDGPFNAVARTRDVKAFETRAMVFAVEYKWRTYGRWIHGAQLLVSLAGAVLFFWAQVSFALGRHGLRMLGDEDTQQVEATAAAGLMAASAAPTVVLLLLELIQMGVQIRAHTPQLTLRSMATGLAQGLRHHFDNLWNWLELLCYIMMLVSAAVFASYLPLSVPVAGLCGCTNVVVTFNALSLLRPYREFGHLIQMVLQILRDIWAFLIVMLICLVGFTMAFVTMLPAQRKFQVPLAFLTLFQMMLGNWDLEQFNDPYELYDGDATLTVLSVIVLVLYTVFVLVIAMNLLIAIMADSYNKVQAEHVVHGRIQRANTLVAMEWIVLLLCRMRWIWSEDECFPMFLHVMTAADNEDVKERQVLSDTQQIKSEISAVKADVKAEVAAITAGMVTKMEFAEIQELLRRMSASMDAVPRDTEVVGDTVGESVGSAVVGDTDRDTVGDEVGDAVGDVVGSEVVGDTVGDAVGDEVGTAV